MSRTSAVTNALSPARLTKYLLAAGWATSPDVAALELYAWNAQVSSALLMPLHVCEVVIRNAVNEVLAKIYGARWPCSQGFLRALGTSGIGFDPGRELLKITKSLAKELAEFTACASNPAAPPTVTKADIDAAMSTVSTGKVIAEMKFVFWQKMFTSQHEGRLWIPHLTATFPNLDPKMSVTQHRQQIHDDLEQIRGLRNRIAHHEPIFNRTLSDDYKHIERLIRGRCNDTAEWMTSHQHATILIDSKPEFPVPRVGARISTVT